MVAELIV